MFSMLLKKKEEKKHHCIYVILNRSHVPDTPVSTHILLQTIYQINKSKNAQQQQKEKDLNHTTFKMTNMHTNQPGVLTTSYTTLHTSQKT